ncbi:GNAT family N-acetyltransferase [Streptomyces chumphonensis]|uniref:GNAT family N-acetyltransferase n=1 Tax=Streptomyces chumphonensis TaxID=1214925 RepID=UPI002964FD0D|nr:GNAT family N-acetyltransferase [Streptomyces chumphonensis]
MPTPDPATEQADVFGGPGGPAEDDTLDLELPPELRTGPAGPAGPPGSPWSPGSPGSPGFEGPVPDAAPGTDLVGAVDRWRAARGSFGTFQLVPVRLERDLTLVTAWMNDPAVAAFWALAGDEDVTAKHLRPQLEGDGRSVPCLGVLDGVPMSYWEIYRADLDPLARYFPTLPHDTGLHVLIGPADRRGRGLGAALLGAVSELVLTHRPACRRVLAEPDVRNAVSVSAFLRAGYRRAAEVDLPDKRAAVVVRERGGIPAL